MRRVTIISILSASVLLTNSGCSEGVRATGAVMIAVAGCGYYFTEATFVDAPDQGEDLQAVYGGIAVLGLLLAAMPDEPASYYAPDYDKRRRSEFLVAPNGCLLTCRF